MAKQAVKRSPVTTATKSALDEMAEELKNLGVSDEEAADIMSKAQDGIEEGKAKIEDEEAEAEEVSRTKVNDAKADAAREKDTEFIASIVNKMEKQFGKGAALTPTAETVLCKVEHWISTRNFLIDSAIAGGLPMPRPLIPFGRMTEISGLNTTGKTTLMGMIIAETQATGGIAAVSDTEEALDLAYWEQLGVDLSRLIIIPALTIEEVFTKVESLVDVIREAGDDRLICIGWDSLGGTPTKEQEAAAADDKFYASAAKVVGQNLQRIVGKISKMRIALVITNHLYRKMDVKYGDPWETYGGEKMKFFATLRIRLQQVGQISEGVDEDKQIIGHTVKVKIVKNKMAPILRSVNVPCIGGYGFSMDYSVYEQGQQQGIIDGKQWKSWKSPHGEVKFQGWRGFREKVMPHPDYQDLVEKVISNYFHKMIAK